MKKEHLPYESSQFLTRLLLSVLLSSVLSLPAVAQRPGQAISDTLHLRFRLNKTDIDFSFENNWQNWRAFQENFIKRYSQLNPAAIRLDIYAGASPEGPATWNRYLGEHRGQSIAELIKEHYGHRVGEIVVHNEAARWKAFREVIDKSQEPFRKEVLSIIDLPASTNEGARDHREDRLRQLWGGYAWPVLLEKYLAPLRSGASGVISYLPERDTLYVRDTLLVRDTVFIGRSDTVFVQPRDTAVSVACWKPVLSLKTNLLFDAVLAPNLEIEVPFGWSRWSFMAEWWTPWYRWHGHNKGNRCYEVLMVGGELRYWLSRRDPDCPHLLAGHFLGIYGAGGKYDAQLDRNTKHEGWQGEYSSFGLTYGYASYLSRHWRLEFTASGGYVGGPQRHYHGMFDDSHLIWQRTQRLRYVGPTKLKVTLALLLGKRAQHKKKGGKK